MDTHRIINSTQQRIEILANTKNKLKESIQPLLFRTEMESVSMLYQKLYAHLDKIIAE